MDMAGIRRYGRLIHNVLYEMEISKINYAMRNDWKIIDSVPFLMIMAWRQQS